MYLYGPCSSTYQFIVDIWLKEGIVYCLIEQANHWHQFGSLNKNDFFVSKDVKTNYPATLHLKHRCYQYKNDKNFIFPIIIIDTNWPSFCVQKLWLLLYYIINRTNIH